MGLPDVVCFSQLRWDFVFQRPQHLMSRAARTRRVFYVEEPRLTTRRVAYLRQRMSPDGVLVCTPYLPRITHESAPPAIAALVRDILDAERVRRPVVWYSTPMAEPIGREIDAACRVYDCMDDLAGFRHASRRIHEHETRLLATADLVFTGGQSLYEAKSALHPRVHAFPSAVDVRHFARARLSPPEPPDLNDVPRPRLCFVGVIDERIDLDLVVATADARPGWHVVMIGPTAKISRRQLPVRPNVHYLGKKDYDSLPDYLAHVDAGIMPFAINRATRYISPTKTPEYLAAGLPVISTPIADVVRGYGERGFVAIASGVDAFVAACEVAISEPRDEAEARRRRADELLARISWDATWARMDRLILRAVADRAVERAETAGRRSDADALRTSSSPTSGVRRDSHAALRPTAATRVAE